MIRRKILKLAMSHERTVRMCMSNAVAYGKTKEHKALLAEGKALPPWKDVKIRCHDFRVTFCTTCYEAGIKIKTLQAWMGHADATMIMDIYAKLTEERELKDTTRLDDYTKSRFSA